MEELYIQELSPQVSIDELLLEESKKEQIVNFIKEHKHAIPLIKLGLPVSNTLLLHGHTGCGKTFTARIIASELKKRLLIVNLSNIVSSKLGDTAKNIAMLFRKAANTEAVLFFDELDALGQRRDLDASDASEMRRVVNSILQLIDNLPPEAVLVGATNQLKLIDTALLRRFDTQVEFVLPSPKDLDVYYDSLEAKYPVQFEGFQREYNISIAQAQARYLLFLKKEVIAELEEKQLVVPSTKEESR
ncbi:MAG TPA: ATP-binding protein [Flavobacteriaceae bacterium]|nr:ATP-binding protein [Flavobacteriaceae bacterium]